MKMEKSMLLQKITLLQYVLLKMDQTIKDDTIEYIKAIRSVRNLFTSQGLDTISYLDFEAEFPECCRDAEEIIKFVLRNKVLVKMFLIKTSRIEKNYSRKPTKFTSTDFDKDDYERSQILEEIPFHM